MINLWRRFKTLRMYFMVQHVCGGLKPPPAFQQIEWKLGARGPQRRFTTTMSTHGCKYFEWTTKFFQGRKLFHKSKSDYEKIAKLRQQRNASKSMKELLPTFDAAAPSSRIRKPTTSLWRRLKAKVLRVYFDF